MCERTCPTCRSTEHIGHYGICGYSLICEGCGAVLANRADPEAAHTDLDEAGVEAWWREHSFVTPGAEARNPADDLQFTRMYGDA